mmetsp:Transcript_1912/g.6855  ORF Transcript_1912/g.6855 Transcript_1912/m.6855 type:complete len:265 (+) Transcript_1912:2081-2875(+)
MIARRRAVNARTKPMPSQSSPDAKAGRTLSTDTRYVSSLAWTMAKATRVRPSYTPVCTPLVQQELSMRGFSAREFASRRSETYLAGSATLGCKHALYLRLVRAGGVAPYLWALLRYGRKGAFGRGSIAASPRATCRRTASACASRSCSRASAESAEVAAPRRAKTRRWPRSAPRSSSQPWSAWMSWPTLSSVVRGLQRASETALASMYPLVYAGCSCPSNVRPSSGCASQLALMLCTVLGGPSMETLLPTSRTSTRLIGEPRRC